MKKLAIPLALSLMLSAGQVWAHADHLKPQFGGITAEADVFQVELVTKGNQVILYLSEHGAPVESAGASGKLETGTASSNVAQIAAVDAALSAINDRRATLGAVQSRFENTVAFLRTSSENQSAARGRIIDADFAAETANLSRAQILQQAGTAMIAQANQLPQGVLSLLR